MPHPAPGVPRLLYLSPIAELGGAERSLLDLLAAVRSAQPEWTLQLIAGTDGPLLDRAAALGVQVSKGALCLPPEFLVLDSGTHSPWSVFRRSFRAFRAARSAARQLQAAIADLQPSLIHSNGIRTHLLTGMLERNKIPIVWHMRDFISDRRLSRTVLRWAAPAAKLIIANSQATARDATKVLRGVPTRTVLNALDFNVFYPGTENVARLDELASMPPAPANTLRIGLVASYARWKGHDIFLRAASQLLKESNQSPVRFYVIGGPLFSSARGEFAEAELRACAEREGLSAHIGFIPFQSAPAAIYRALDIVVHASTQPEPFGRVVAEGMACGRPVIATFTGGICEFVRPGIDALAVPPGNVAALAAAMRELINDSPLRNRLAGAAHATAIERFSLARLGAEIIDAYRAVSPLTFGAAHPNIGMSSHAATADNVL